MALKREKKSNKTEASQSVENGPSEDPQDLEYLVENKHLEQAISILPLEPLAKRLGDDRVKQNAVFSWCWCFF